MRNLISIGYKLVLCAGLVCSTACNTEDPTSVGGGTNDNNAAIPGVNTDELALFVYNGSTEINMNGWEENNHDIGLFLTRDSINNHYENDENSYANIKCSYTEMGWYTSPPVVKLTQNPAVIYAYAPYRNNIDPYKMNVECESGTVYMYGSHLTPQTSVRKGDNYAKILMKRIQAQVDFRIRKKGWKKEVVLQGVVIRKRNSNKQQARTGQLDAETGLPVSGTFNLQNAEITHTAYGIYDSNPMNSVITEEFSDANRVVFTVMPLDIQKDDVELVFTINNMEKSIVLKDYDDWEAGTRNIYNVTFTGTEIIIEGSIKPWIDIEQDIIVNT